jgi:hypothetical protein
MALPKRVQQSLPQKANAETQCPMDNEPKIEQPRRLAIDLRSTNTTHEPIGLPYVVANDVTFGVSTVGNIPALHLCLLSILSGPTLPSRILIRSEGPFPSFCDFYLEQLAELSRIKGVIFSFNVTPKLGARKGCDWLMENCNTEMLLMGDDDVIYEQDALASLRTAVAAISRVRGNWAFIVGNKRDVNNRRGYGDFSQQPLDPNSLEDFSSTNLYYGYASVPIYPQCVALDTGHVLLNLGALRHTGLKFACYGEDYNSGGYDSLMGMRITSAGLKGYFDHRSKSWHLEKEKQNFNEFSQRKSYLAAAARDLNLDPTLVDKVFGWVK